MIKTEHILYINSNTRYKCSRGDGEEFNRAIDTLNKFELHPFKSFKETSYMGDYISGMYPEFEKALKYFHDEFYKYPDEMKTDELMHAKAKVTMKKFGLGKEYDFDSEPNKEQLQRLNKRIKPKQKNEAAKFAQGCLKDIAFALIDTCDDYRQIHQFLNKINVIARTVSGRYPEELIMQNQDAFGAKEGLEFLALKKQGIIDEQLNVVDADAFCSSKLVKEFSATGKVYDLSESLSKIYGKPLNNKVVKDFSSQNKIYKQIGS